MNDLIPVQNPNVPALFQPMGLQSILDQIEADAKTLVPDLSTKKGRDAIASTAARVARSKTYLDNLGKEYVAELKELPKQVDAERKRMRDRLDALRDEVRKPLTDWEQAETERVDAINARISDFDSPPAVLDVAFIQSRMDEISAIVIDDSFSEFKDKAAQAQELALFRLSKQMDQAKESARLESERKALEIKQRQEREAKIAAEAAARAKADAERIAAEAQARAEAARKSAEQAKADAERRAKEAEERAIAQAEAARKATEQAKADAAKAERDRIEREQRAQAAADAKRAADKEHAASVNRAVLTGLRDAGLSEEQGKAVIRAILQGAIKHLTINY